MKLRALVAAAACAFGVLPAQAEIWGYVDAQGTAHFASGKLDERYELFFRGGESFDTAEGVAAPAAAPPQPAPADGRVLSLLELSPGFRRFQPHVSEAAREHGIELALLQALIAAESGFDPAAVSPKGAVGLMQLMPATAQRYGIAGDSRMPIEKKLKDPRTNLRTGARYLRDLLRMFPGRLELALAAYNAGEGAVQRAGQRIPDYPETRNYVRTVMQLYTVLKPAAPVVPPQAGTAAVVPAQAGTQGAVGAASSAPRRVRMELPGPAGGGRRNMPPRLAGVTPPGGPGEPALVAHDELPSAR